MKQPEAQTYIGLLHFRYEKEIPPPHFRVHSIYGPHCPQWPSVGFSLRFFTHCPLMHHWIINKVKIKSLALGFALLHNRRLLPLKSCTVAEIQKLVKFAHRAVAVLPFRANVVKLYFVADKGFHGLQSIYQLTISLPGSLLAALLPIGRKKNWKRHRRKSYAKQFSVLPNGTLNIWQNYFLNST